MSMFASADDSNEVCSLPLALLPSCSATFPAHPTPGATRQSRFPLSRSFAREDYARTHTFCTFSSFSCLCRHDRRALFDADLRSGIINK